MTDSVHVGSWATIDSGCPMSYKFPDDGGISLTFGALMDLLFDEESFRRLAHLSAEAVRDIDARTGTGHLVIEGGQPNH